MYHNNKRSITCINSKVQELNIIIIIKVNQVYEALELVIISIRWAAQQLHIWGTMHIYLY